MKNTRSLKIILYGILIYFIFVLIFFTLIYFSRNNCSLAHNCSQTFYNKKFLNEKGKKTIILKCFLTVTPNELCYNFVKQLPQKKNTYICIDKNDYEIPNYDGEVQIIKVDNKLCEGKGYKDTHSRIRGPTSREKALYYFIENRIQFDFIWFIEEDVLIPTTTTLEHIDRKYPDQDLLVRDHEIIYRKKKNWHWRLVNNQLRGKLDLPYASTKGAGICAIRCSKKMIDCVQAFVAQHNTLFFCEAVFNTIALHNKLNVKGIKELRTIVWRKNWEKHEIKKTNLYHPVKSMKKQYEMRNYLHEIHGGHRNRRHKSKK